MKKNIYFAPLFFFISILCFSPAKVLCAEEFHCEVLSLHGHATVMDADQKVRELKEGDLLGKDESLEVAPDSAVDLAFDKEWKNVVRVEEKSKLKVAQISPTKLELGQGGVFAKLKALPKDSSFDVKTPTAVATVRGTEYRTTYVDGHTEVFNVSPSKVFVYGVKADGSVNREQSVVLEQSKKTQVLNAGEVPKPSQDLSEQEAKIGEKLKADIETKIQEVQSSGRISKIQSVADLETLAKDRQIEPNSTDESRVVDLRRRPFKKVDSATNNV